MAKRKKTRTNKVKRAPVVCQPLTQDVVVESEFYDVEEVLAEMEVTLRPTREQFEMIRDADWGDVLADSSDPVALVGRLAALAARLDREGYSGDDVDYASWDGDGVTSGVDSIWRCWLSCCLSLAEERPELAQENCALPLGSVGRVFHTWTVGPRIVRETVPSAVSE